MNTNNNIRNNTFQKVSGFDLLLCGISVAAIIPSFYTEESSSDSTETRQQVKKVTSSKKSSVFNSDLNSSLLKENFLVGGKAYLFNVGTLAVEDAGLLVNVNKYFASFFDDSVILGGQFSVGARLGNAYTSSNPFDGSEASDASQLTPEKAVKSIIDLLPVDSQAFSTLSKDLRTRIADLKTATKELAAAGKDDKAAKRKALDDCKCDLIKFLTSAVNSSDKTIKNKDFVAYMQLSDGKSDEVNISNGLVTALETALDLKQAVIDLNASPVDLKPVDFSASETIEMARAIFPDKPVALSQVTSEEVSREVALKIFQIVSTKAETSTKSSGIFKVLSNPDANTKLKFLKELSDLLIGGDLPDTIDLKTFKSKAPILASVIAIPTTVAPGDDIRDLLEDELPKLEPDRTVPYLSSMIKNIQSNLLDADTYTLDDLKAIIDVAAYSGTNYKADGYQKGIEAVSALKSKFNASYIQDTMRPYILNNLGMVFSMSGNNTQVVVPTAAIDKWKEAQSFASLGGDDLTQKIKSIFSGQESTFLPAITTGLAQFIKSTPAIQKTAERLAFSKTVRNNTWPASLDFMFGPSVATTVSAFDSNILINLDLSATGRVIEDSGTPSCLLGGALTGFVGFGVMDNKLFVGPSATWYFIGNGYKEGQVSIALQGLLASSYFSSDEAQEKPAPIERKTRSTTRR